MTEQFGNIQQAGLPSSSLKIVNPFSLMPKEKQRLQGFLEANYDALLSKQNQPALEMLADLIGGRGEHENKGVFPPEALAEIGRVFDGISENVVIVQNLPEKTAFNEDGELQRASTYYSSFIAQALKMLVGAEAYFSEFMGTRHSNNPDKRTASHPGNHLHADRFNRKHQKQYGGKDLGITQRDNSHLYVDCILFSSPLNDEHAVTQLTHLRKAIETLSTEALQTKVHVDFLDDIVAMEQGSSPPDNEPMTLAELLTKINQPSHRGHLTEGIVYGIFFPENTPAEVVEAIQKHSMMVNFQPGTIAILSEQQIFHQAHAGEQSYIDKIPQNQSASRMFVHFSTGRPQSPAR